MEVENNVIKEIKKKQLKWYEPVQKTEKRRLAKKSIGMDTTRRKRKTEEKLEETENA